MPVAENGAAPSSISDLLNSPALKTKWVMALNDPYYWVKYFLSPKVFNIFDNHPKQIQFLRESVRANEAILACASRSGKTFTLGLIHLWAITFRVRPENSFFYNDYTKTYQTLNACMTLNQAKIVFDNIIELINESPFYSSFEFIKKVERGQTPYILTCLNSKFEARPTSMGAAHILGQYFDKITLDEAASEKDLNHLRFKTLGSRRADVSGSIIFASTPTGNSTFREYWYEYKDRKLKGDNVALGRFSKFDNPINSHDFIYKEMESLSQIQIDEEIFGRFSDYGSTYFSPADILQALNVDLPVHIPLDEPETGNCDPLSYEPRNKVNSVFFSGLDIAGQGADATCLITLELVRNFNSINHINLVSYQRVSKMGLLGANGIIERVKRCFSNYGTDSHQLFYDASSLGGGQLTEVMQHYLPKEMLDNTTGITSSRKPGRSSFNHKYLMLSNLAFLLEKGQLSLPDTTELNQLKKELRFYMYPDDKGLSTDTVMALSLAAYAHAYFASENPNFSDLFFYMQDRLETNYQPYAS